MDKTHKRNYKIKIKIQIQIETLNYLSDLNNFKREKNIIKILLTRVND